MNDDSFMSYHAVFCTVKSVFFLYSSNILLYLTEAMLNQLRNAKRLITKLILLLAGGGLIFYFGYSSFNRNKIGETSGAIAKVNGASIPKLKFERIYENQIKRYEPSMKNPPVPVLNFLKQQVLERLIQNKIFAEQATAIGLRVSDKELAKEITSNPNFYRDGIFDKKLYLENKVYYFQRNGEDLEDTLREELLAEKFEKLIKDSLFVTEEEIRQEYLLKHTQLNLQKTILDEKGSQKIEETKLHSLQDKMIFVGDPQATEALNCILKLTLKNPLCPKEYKIGNQRVSFKLLERKEPDWTKYEQEKLPLQKELLEQQQNHILRQITKALVEKAKIRLYSMVDE